MSSIKQAWQDYWLCYHGQWYRDKETAYDEQSQDSLLHVIEAAPALTRIAELESENQMLQIKYDIMDTQLKKDLDGYVVKLEKQLDEAKKVIQFYASTRNWANSNGAQYYEQFLLIQNDAEGFGRESVGGTKARAFLAKLNEGK